MTQASDLAIRFGRQNRLKCVDCRKFIPSVNFSEVIHCKCGTVWVHVEGTTYVRESHGEKLV